MNHVSFAVLGFLMIGLVTTGLIYWFTLRRITDGNERPNVFRWSAAFGLSICTFMGAAPLLGQDQFWILILPFAGTWLSLDSLHRIGESAAATTSKLVSGDSEIA